ncbi:MAG: LemA family protein [bacterium]|nr:LemA family protein [bacterium]
MKWLIPVGVIAVVLLVVGLLFSGTYNSLVSKSQAVDAQWAQVETQYQRRFDLIPNLVESTKAFFQQEQDIYGKIADARTKYGNARSTEEKVGAANELEGALSRLLVIVEQYPNVKSDATVARLMDELAGTENRVSVARTRYNETIQDYNTTIKRFPTVLIAGMFGFTEKKYFEAQSGADQAPKVNF